MSTGFRDFDSKLWVWKKIKVFFEDYDGFCYESYQISSGNRNKSVIDIFMVHNRLGFISMDIVDWNDTTSIEYLNQSMDNLFNKYENMRNKFRNDLRNGRKEKYHGIPVMVLPSLNRAKWNELEVDADGIFIVCSDDLLEESFNTVLFSELENLGTAITEEDWSVVKAIVQGGRVMESLIRQGEASPDSKKAILQKLEASMSLLDLEQEKVARQIPEGPQRIRGLAGSGKTIVMTMKAALMHIANPQWEIVYVFSTQSLYNQIKDYIERFTLHFANVKPNWDKLHVLHGWGSKNQEGLYSYMCKKYGQKPLGLAEAKSMFGNTSLLGNSCLKLINENQVHPNFDALLMDEAQDFEFEFFRFCHHILLEPKRFIWAYDEVQSLNNLNIPTAKEIFGENEHGEALVNLEGTYPDGIEKDFILFHCYRNPRPVLVAAHFFGMGLFRKEGAIQFIPSEGGWEDIGYEIVSGEFKIGEEVTMRRPFENSPNNIEKLVGYENVLKMRVFQEMKTEINWVANEIKRNLTEDELSPNDILVISVDNRFYQGYGEALKRSLSMEGIDMIIVGEDTATNVFRVDSKVTFSGIRRAKGNEASVVYIVGFDSILGGFDIVQLRNTAFTAMTRSKGWCTITGVGQRAETLFNEIKMIAKNPEKITFKIPDPTSIERLLDNIEYAKRRTKIKEATKIINKLDKILDEDDIKFLDKRSLEKLMRKFKIKVGEDSEQS